MKKGFKSRAEIIKKDILQKIREYYSAALDPSGELFKPGVTSINYAGRVFDENELVNLVDSSLEFWLTHGRYSREFEKGLADFLGIKHALFVNSGSSANFLAFMALTSPALGDKQIKRGDEIITVAATFPTTVAPAVQYGAVPVFVDIELETLNIDTAAMSAALTDRTKAVILAHTLGNPFNISAVIRFCQQNQLWLVEDNCDSLGSTYKGRYTGTFGDIGTSSFYPPHHITTGEGGAVYTQNSLLHKIMLSLRDWGRDCQCETGKDDTCGERFSKQHGTLPLGYDHKYVYSHFGYNFKCSDMQAAIGCAQLEKLPLFIEKRRRNYRILHKALDVLSDYFILPSSFADSEPCWFGFPLIVKDGVGFSRNELAIHLESKKIQTRNLFAGNFTCHPCFEAMAQDRDYRVAGSLVNTDKIMKDCLWLGVSPGISDEQTGYMAETIIAFCKGK